MKKYHTIFVLILCALAFNSCNKDDRFVPLEMITNPDIISLSQNSEIEIFIFQNDQNIPSNALLTLGVANYGNAVLADINNTPNIINDDVVVYSANPNFVGVDSFQYTICDNSENCKTEDITITVLSNSTVNYNIEEMPYQTLSEYQFFDGDLSNLEPAFGVLPYTLNSTLFTDYAKKKRFIWMPNNTKANYINDNIPLEFPLGTVLIKNFYYDNTVPNNETKLIETRLMINKPNGWEFANYVWNSEQSDANLDLDGSFMDLQWQQNNEIKTVQYRIPAGAECHTCHKVMEISQPIGPKPRNLNLEYAYNEGIKNQLDKLIEVGYLSSNIPQDVIKLPNYSNINEPLENRVRAYLDINCAHCHSEETHCAYRPMRFDFLDTENYSNIGVCIDPDTDLGLGLGHIVESGDARNSVLHFRLNSGEVSYRMPLLGRTLIHSEGVELIEEWINSLTNECN